LVFGKIIKSFTKYVSRNGTRLEKRKMKIAITGGIGSGKSLVGKLLKEKGYAVFSCDEIYQEITQEKEYLERLKREFPFAVKEEKLDKKTLASLVFSDTTALKKLNALAHPYILRKLKRDMQNAEGQLVFAEVPLLFEENLQSEFDQVIVVLRSVQKRIKSVQRRDGSNEEEIQNRISSQFDYDKNEEGLKAHYFVIENEGTVLDVQKKLDEILQKLLFL